MKKLFTTTIIFVLVAACAFLLAFSLRKNEETEDVKGVETPTQIIETISVTEAHEIIQEMDVIILDVRSQTEFARGHIPNAINTTVYADLDKDKTYVIYRLTGTRSANALNSMQELDFHEVYNISGGIAAWEEQQLPISQ